MTFQYKCICVKTILSSNIFKLHYYFSVTIKFFDPINVIMYTVNKWVNVNFIK